MKKIFPPSDAETLRCHGAAGMTGESKETYFEVVHTANERVTGGLTFAERERLLSAYSICIDILLAVGLRLQL